MYDRTGSRMKPNATTLSILKIVSPDPDSLSIVRIMNRGELGSGYTILRMLRVGTCPTKRFRGGLIAPHPVPMDGAV